MAFLLYLIRFFLYVEVGFQGESGFFFFFDCCCLGPVSFDCCLLELENIFEIIAI